MLGGDNLGNYFKTNFALMHHHKYSLSELETMIPWQKEVYIAMLVNHLKSEKQRLEQEMLARKGR